MRQLIDVRGVEPGAPPEMFALQGEKPGVSVASRRKRGQLGETGWRCTAGAVRRHAGEQPFDVAPVHRSEHRPAPRPTQPDAAPLRPARELE